MLLLPATWNSLSFKLQYHGRLIEIHLEEAFVTYTLLEGEALPITHNGQSIILKCGEGKKVEVE